MNIDSRETAQIQILTMVTSVYIEVAAGIFCFAIGIPDQIIKDES